MSDFDGELAAMRIEIAAEREALVAALGALGDHDLELVRRGSWAVRDVLRHVIDSEIAYAKVIAHLRGRTADIGGGDVDLTSIEGALSGLAGTRSALLTALDGVDEAAFYELRAVGREQYSVLSVLENVASHDREHLEQIARLADGRQG